MKRNWGKNSSVYLLLAVFTVLPIVATAGAAGQDNTAEKLLVVWTSGDREVALKMVYMYTLNAQKRGWWKNLRLLIWGPSAKLLANDTELQQEVEKMKAAGVELLACKACSDSYEVSEKLTAIGVEVKYMGVPLTEMLKSGWITITF